MIDVIDAVLRLMASGLALWVVWRILRGDGLSFSLEPAGSDGSDTDVSLEQVGARWVAEVSSPTSAIGTGATPSEALRDLAGQLEIAPPPETSP